MTHTLYSASRTLYSVLCTLYAAFRIPHSAFTGLVLCLTTSASAQPIPLSLDVKQHTLRNGLQILTLEDHTLPIVSYYTFFKVGSRHESIGRTGISHLFEHMMFNGARRYGPKEFDQMMESKAVMRTRTPQKT